MPLRRPQLQTEAPIETLVVEFWMTDLEMLASQLPEPEAIRATQIAREVFKEQQPWRSVVRSWVTDTHRQVANQPNLTKFIVRVAIQYRDD